MIKLEGSANPLRPKPALHHSQADSVIPSTAGDSDLTGGRGDRPATFPQLHKPCTLRPTAGDVPVPSSLDAMTTCPPFFDMCCDDG